MKPKEFDELIRQKFDRNDFEYNPRNWDKLAEELDGRAKKRSMMMVWWMPLMGIAASVALTVGVTSFFRQSNPGNSSVNTEIAQARTFIQPLQTEEPVVAKKTVIQRHLKTAKPVASKRKHTTVNENPADWFAISYQNAIGNNARKSGKGNTENAIIVKSRKKTLPSNEGIITFAPDREFKKSPKLSIVLTGGVNRGSQNSGYMAGASIRKMVNDKVYIESDIAFASSNNTQTTQYLVSEGTTSNPVASSTGVASKITAVEGNKPATPVKPAGIVKEKDISYNLYYAQVTPTVGYKLLKKMSVGVGPDFQKVLVDNRPDPSSVDRGTIQEAPLFDVGLMGKTEYALTKKFTAAVFYRKGVNNVITPMGKYIDRDYMQFQIKYTILNK
jgi:hypothetical protein